MLVIVFLQAHINRLLAGNGVFFPGKGDGFAAGLEEGRWWHAEELGIALQRTAQTWQAILFVMAFGLYVTKDDLIDVDCCHSYVPRSFAHAVGPDDQWVLTFCHACEDTGRC